MPELNPPQRQAAAHVSGPLIVFAGAGSGKTRVITYRIANLLATEHVPPYRILAVTFTNKAAAEMRARVQQLTGPEVARDLWIGTFHSVCARLLRRHHAAVGLGRNFVIYDDADQKALLSRVLKDMGLSDYGYPPKVVLSLVSREKQEGYSPEETRREGRMESTLTDVYERYQGALLRANAVDFDDLLLYMMRISESQTPDGVELRARFQHVLVDEFQDTNLIQYRLVHALSESTQNLCVVGDDDQSIYRWRGADVRLIRNFRRDFPKAEVVKLEQNYRSTANIVAAALGVIEPARNRVPKVLWTEIPAGDPVRVRTVNDEREEASFVAGTIRGEIGRGTPADQIAVFYRVHAQSRTLEEALRGLNIPYQIIGGMKFFDRAEVKDLLAYLRLVTNPKSDTDLFRIINVPARGLGGKTVEKLASMAAENTLSAFEAMERLIASDELGKGPKQKLTVFRDLILDLMQAAGKLRASELARRTLEATGYETALRADDTAEADARLGNLEEAVGAIADYEQELEARGEAASIEGYLERVSLIANADTRLDTALVSLMTVHSAKGLEFGVVFLTGMEETIFPYRGVDQSHGDSEEDLDEERRLAYVAITRGKKRLFITHAQVRQLFGRTHYLSPSRFLDDLPASAVVREGRPGFGASPGRFGGGANYASRDFAPKSAPRLEPGMRIVVRDEAAVSSRDEGIEIVVRPGTRVNHRTFGRGIVESVESGERPIVVARFERVGRKRIQSDFLEFE